MSSRRNATVRAEQLRGKRNPGSRTEATDITSCLAMNYGDTGNWRPLTHWQWPLFRVPNRLVPPLADPCTTEILVSEDGSLAGRGTHLKYAAVDTT